VAVAGAAGTTIIDSITELDDFEHEPWTAGSVTGPVVFPGLQQTAGRRAILRDDDAYPVFVATVNAVEPALTRMIDRVNADVDRATVDRLSDTLRRVFGAVLRELDDIDNPMRTYLGSVPGEGGLLAELSRPGMSDGIQEPSLEELTPRCPVSCRRPTCRRTRRFRARDAARGFLR